MFALYGLLALACSISAQVKLVTSAPRMEPNGATAYAALLQPRAGWLTLHLALRSSGAMLVKVGQANPEGVPVSTPPLPLSLTL